MKKYEKIYQNLRKKYTDEEIIDSMLIPEDLTKGEREKADNELRAFRFQLLQKQTEKQRIYSDLIKLKFQIENYIYDEDYSAEKSFGKFLEAYVRILKITKKELSKSLNIHYTRLSRLFNDREEPNVELMYRLDKHSGNLIPALLWWRIMSKKQEYIIKKDVKTRKKEASKVISFVNFQV